MAGLLARLAGCAFPFQGNSDFLQPALMRLTAAGTAPELHGIPFYQCTAKERIFYEMENVLEADKRVKSEW